MNKIFVSFLFEYINNKIYIIKLFFFFLLLLVCFSIIHVRNKVQNL